MRSARVCGASARTGSRCATSTSATTRMGSGGAATATSCGSSTSTGSCVAARRASTTSPSPRANAAYSGHAPRTSTAPTSRCGNRCRGAVDNRDVMILRFFGRYPLVVLALVSLATVLGLLAAGRTELAQVLATAVITLVILITAWDMVRAIRAGSWGLDILAVVAMISTVLVGEYVAGLIIVLMLTGGEAIEDYAANRAGRELDALLDRAPSFANREIGRASCGER